VKKKEKGILVESPPISGTGHPVYQEIQQKKPGEKKQKKTGLKKNQF